MANYIDTRDLYKRQCELQDELDDLAEAVSGASEELNECEDEDDQEALADTLNEATAALEDWREEYQEELDELNSLQNEVGREWHHGTALIAEDDFEEYAQELAEDLYGREIQDASWPFSCIDWERAAEELKQDYSVVTYQGTDYLFRS